MIIKHFGKIVNGKRLYYNVDLHREAIFDLEGQEFEETIKLKHKRVSEDAFAYYYAGVIGTALNFETFEGWDKNDLDAELKSRFLFYYKTLCIKHLDGTEEFITQKKTYEKKAISSKVMKEFTDRCIVWLAELGIVVQPSENFVYGKYKTETIKK
jgi:hypothetical protein